MIYHKENRKECHAIEPFIIECSVYTIPYRDDTARGPNRCVEHAFLQGT